MTRSEFEQIAAQLRQKVLKTGLDFFGNKEDAEDAAQDTMVQLWRYLEHIDTQRNVEALAVRVAKNCCVSIYRKRQPVTPLLEGQGEASPQAEDARRDAQSAETPRAPALRHACPDGPLDRRDYAADGHREALGHGDGLGGTQESIH